MYTPPCFVEADSAKLHDFIEAHSFGVMVSDEGGSPEGSHLPFLLDRDVHPIGRLIGHMAEANPQWRRADGKRVLTIFSGPHTYVSPTWYEATNTVPTWNYVAVHVTGSFRVIDDREAVREIVRRTVDVNEARMPSPWSMEEVETDFADRLLDAVVGFSINIARIEGKWKLNQNHNRQRRERVIRALQSQPGEPAHQIAALMADTLLE